jgi:hypothetical protein
MSRTTMPRARPLITIRSSISVRLNILTVPAAIWRASAWYAPSSKLLPRLPARIEGARHLRAAKGAIVEHAAVLTRKGHALRHALVDDGVAHLGQAVDIGLARAEVAALDRVVEEAVDAVAVIAIILGGIDAALRGHAVRAARAVLIGSSIRRCSQLTQRRCRRTARQPRTDDDDLESAPVGRVDQLHLELAALPQRLHRAGGHTAIQRRFDEGGCFGQCLCCRHTHDLCTPTARCQKARPGAPSQSR